jgi:hypothetical protein
LLFAHAALFRVRDFRSPFLCLRVPLRRQEPCSWVLNRAAELRRPRPRRMLSFDGFLSEHAERAMPASLFNDVALD